jgi:hypothetical protein
MKNHDQAREVAESSFKKKQRRLLEGQKAMAEYNAALRAENAKTDRLRALRLTRDAAEKMAPAKGTKVSSAKKKIPATCSPAVRFGS